MKILENKFIWWWIKGSAICLIFMILTLFTGQKPIPVVHSSSMFFEWFMNFILALSPIGAIIGYGIIWILMLILSAFGIEKEKMKKITKWTPQQKSTLVYDRSIGGAIKCKIDSNGYVYQGSLTRSPLGRVDNGKVYSKGMIESGSPLGSFDDNGNIYEGIIGSSIIGKVDSAGNVYKGIVGGGDFIGKVEGDNIFAGGAALLLLVK